MTKFYNQFREYFLNGVYAYALFGLYALTISPYIMEFIDYGEQNAFVGILGLAIYGAEFFAINFKLKMARIRAEIRRKLHRESTGLDIIPRPNKLVFFGLMMRIALRLVILMFSLTAFGITCTGNNISHLGPILMLAGVFLDLGGLTYIYFKTGFYREPAFTKRELIIEEKENIAWLNFHVPLYFTKKYYLRELLADFVLHTYAIMLLTPIWYFINQQWLESSKLDYVGANKDGLLSLLIAVSIVWIAPLRIAYWIEDSMMAFKTNEKIAMWVIFFIVAIFSFLPTLAQVNSSQIEWVIFQQPYINFTLSVFLILIVLAIHFILGDSKKELQIQLVESQ